MKGKKLSHKKTKTMGTSLAMGVLMFGLAALYYFYEYWLRVAPTVMSTELKQFFNISDPMLGHLAACYYYAYVVMQIPVGVIFDRYSARTVLTLACAICVGGTFLFCQTTSFWVAQLGRFLMGFGSAFAYVGVLKISSLWFHKKYFGISAGLCTALGMIGGYSGLTFIGWLVQTEGWQPGLQKIAWSGVALTILLWVALRDKPAKAIVSDKHEDKATPARIKTGPRLLHSFTGILASPKIWLSGLVGSLTYLPISAFAELWAVPYLEAAGYAKAEAAACSGTLLLGFAIGGPLWGIISAALNRRQLPLIIGSLLSAIASMLIITLPHTPTFWMSCLFFLCGLFASAQILVFAVASDLCVKRINATAVAFTNMLVMLGGALLQPVIGVLLHFVGSSEPHMEGMVRLSHGVQSYKWSLLVLPASLLLAAACSWFIHEPEPRLVPKIKRR